MPKRGLIIAAPSSASGKTTITLGLLKALMDKGVRLRSAKIGPDYIDPMFHMAATGLPCRNLDGWAMGTARLADQIDQDDAELLIAEGVMGLFDGAATNGATNDGSAAAMARLTGWPVVLVVDASHQAQSAAALLHGFSSFDPDITVAGVIFNRVGSDKHRRLLSAAAERVGLPVFGHVPRRNDLVHPSRHLGLVPATERTDLTAFIAQAGALIAQNISLDEIMTAAEPARNVSKAEVKRLPPLGQRIAIARDEAFCFLYDHVLADWRHQGAELSFFSPLAGDGPDGSADAIYLPGGYPELHAAKIAGSSAFLSALGTAHEAGAPIFGECGGYMVLGEALVDRDGARHQMADLLPVVTSFETPKLHLGYRCLTALTDNPLGAAGSVFMGHEFHYASTLSVGPDSQPLFAAEDAEGHRLQPMGLSIKATSGSFAHLIDRA